ncbi:LysR family transcriptional regulator [Paracoccus sp. YIM 132242]|uniref:LysR family transcriptional regulator n=1 Tax=Paracoccus lichenicola TaxID=2665644 RepID=A0A6L6HUH7_9RHOB|nr:LysR family transcriptional regulator [Paracoccus lichenicola]MTE01970.1 LysR family transcriptional regulator [Paracoccus lichenicola]
MRLNERHLMQLAAVLDAGGVSEGAALLGLTQPAVSRSLSMLEARIGEPLFVKGRRPLQATPLAAQLAAQGRVILAASRQASDAVQGFVKGSKGLVRVGGVPFFMDAMISRMIGAFQCREPEITIQQSYMNLPEVTAALEGDQIDLGIVAIGEVSSGPGFEFTEILPGRNVVACRPSHPLMRKRPVEAGDLTAYPWVAPLPGSPLMSDLQMILMSIGMSDLNIRYSGGSLLSVVNVLAETDALAVLPFSVVFALRDGGHVTVLPYQIPQPNRSLGIMRRAGGLRNPASDRFASHVIAAFDSLRHAIKRHETAVIWGHS